MQNNFIVDN